MRLLRPLALVLVPLSALLAVAPVRAEDDILTLVRDYEATLAKRDDAGYAAQRAVLTRIADLRTPHARTILDGFLRAYGSDRRAAAEILGASVRHGTPRDLDAALAWAEARRDPLLLEVLGGVVAAAEEPATREYARTTALQKATPPMKAAIARGLGATGDAAAVMPLLLVLREPDLRVRGEAMEALGKLRDPRAVGPLAVFLREEDPRLRDAAARALGTLGDPAATTPLRRVVEADPHPLVVETAAAALATLDRPDAIPTLVDRLAKAVGVDLRLEDALVHALHALSGKAFGTDVEQWRAWWDVVKGKPFSKPAPDPAGTTVQGLRYYEFPIRSSRLVFVIDVSRSMGWNERLDHAKGELVKVLERLPASTRFNVISFSDDAKAWAPRLEDAKPSDVRRAVKHVEHLQPDHGTNTWEALRLALADEEADTIFFLSDGTPSGGDVVDTEIILAEVRNLNRWRRVRIHTVALVMGDPPTAYAGIEDADRAIAFMRRLASENDGDAKVVR